MSEINHSNPHTLFDEIALMIAQSRKSVQVQANSALTLLFWNIGKRIHTEVLREQRAAYGKEIVVTLSRQLEQAFGRSFEEKNLRRMVQFAEQFPDEQMVVTLSRELSWSHILVVLPLKNKEAQHYYIHQIAAHAWSVRALRKQIENKAFERTEIANSQVAKSDTIPVDTFKDPYVLDFLGLHNTFLEADLEQAILRELEAFILELGKGFAFVQRQKRMIVDGEDFYLDLLFYNRNIKRLVAIELKIGKFQAAHKGQMELYLKWLSKYEKQEGENEPIGLILCAESNKEQVELLELHKDGIMVAEYLTQMPPKKELEKKLHQLWLEAKARIHTKQLINEDETDEK